MAFKPLDTRQIVNRSALPHIGSSANDNLADILSKIDAIIGGGSSSTSGWLAGNLPITGGSNTVSYSFVSTMPDTSYVVLLTMQNLVDVNPQFLQPIDVIKTVNGFTVILNAATDTANYSVNYIIPSKTLVVGEFPISNGVQSVTVPLGVPDNGPSYGLVALIQNLTDPNPQFHSLTVTGQTASNFTFKLNSTTDSANYQAVYLKMANVQTALGLGVSSISQNVPVAYGTANYAVMATISSTDTNPQFFSPMITAKSGSAVTVKLSQETDSVNYTLSLYVISLA